MRLLSTLVLLSCALFSPKPFLAQNAEFKNALSAKLNFLDYGLFYNQELALSQGFEIGYYRNVHKYVNIGVPVKIGLSKLPPTLSDNMITFSADAIAQVSNTASKSKFIPYAFAGIGIASDDVAGSYPLAPVGAGLQYKIGKYAFLVAQGEFRKALSDNNRDNFQGSVGFVYLLHKPDPRELDADKDGTPDALDKCPAVAGPATALGCPDMDKDGVADNEDLCPDLPGPLETNGCPDTDGDGYTDTKDKCPETPGTLDGCPDTDKDGFADPDDECPDAPGRWKGCPDTDLDGLPDKDDACPNEAGAPENKGCPEKKNLDTDKDGFNDEMDECPTEPGTINGCPDTDQDGVADKNDQCPDQAGVASNNGCPEKPRDPDTDGDGTPDSKDECPNRPGTVKGCPDTDGDGVADKDDSCPSTPGDIDNKGCPKVIDTDKDGIPDATDPCPGLAGTVNGCPDKDKDGVADKDDVCPEIAGVPENKGCPVVTDTDKDGFEDKDDLCPGLAGTANGCPDADKDGIADNDDLCPNEAGPKATKGCPDTDNDGVADRFDRCPDQAGAIEGCPDKDGDGIADKFDPCPDKAGKFGGCPDTDSDGIADDQDECPDQAGPTSNMGCPVKEQPKDTDGDGLTDDKDKCPNTKGPASNNGCPLPEAPKDTDGDGVMDDVDKCPTTKGPASNSGCPEVRKETKERLAFAMQAVQFESGKALLKGESYSILDEIVEIMRQYPDYKLAISGHTDNVGDDEANLRLSTERAKSCYDYFVFRGISSARLRFAGFGELRPLADNETASGREVNRRVEFELTLD